MVSTSSLPPEFFTWNSNTALVCGERGANGARTFFWRSFFSASDMPPMPSWICLKYSEDLNSLIFEWGW